MKPAKFSKAFTIRLFVFLSLAAAGLFYIAKDTSSGEIKGDKSQDQLPSDEIGISKDNLNDTNIIDEVAEKIIEIIPVDVRNNIEEKIGRESEALEDTKAYNQVKEAVDQAAKEISGFPEKQTKEVKKQIIMQVCDDLLKKLENE